MKLIQEVQPQPDTVMVLTNAYLFWNGKTPVKINAKVVNKLELNFEYMEGFGSTMPPSCFNMLILSKIQKLEHYNEHLDKYT